MKVYSEGVVKKARRLRRQDLSYGEIGNLLKVSNTTIRRWCFGIEAGKGRSLKGIKRNKNIREQIVKKEELLFNGLGKTIDRGKAKLLASIFYWCEGAKYPIVSGLNFEILAFRHVKSTSSEKLLELALV